METLNKPENFNWTPVIKLPNYLTEFLLENPGVLSPTDFKDFHILRTFTQFEVRSYELAILQAIKPNLNSLMDVNFTTKWDPNFQILDAQGSKPIQAFPWSRCIYKAARSRKSCWFPLPKPLSA